MDLFIHNLKIAVRNLLKYKLQTVISVLSIAVGIVTLAFAHSAIERVKLPAIYHQPYYDRTYRVELATLVPDSAAEAKYSLVTKDVVRALKRDGGLECAERIAVPNLFSYEHEMDFHLCDSSVYMKFSNYCVMDPEFIDMQGLRSAITGERIKRLDVGEAIICKSQTELLFGDRNPVGAVQTQVNEYSPLPFTIVDVCEDFSVFDNLSPRIYISSGDSEGEEYGFKFEANAYRIEIVMKEGCAEHQLLDEINARINPFNLKASLEREADKNNVASVLFINTIVYLISSLILIAAVIGFLRMQVQLFWSRRREVSLRIVNGATRWRLFCLFITETLITIALSVVTAILMGGWLERYLYTTFGEKMTQGEITIHNLSQYSCGIGALLLVICCIIIYIAIARICKDGQGLQASLRHSHTHTFSNILLCVQIAISFAFVCGAFIMLNWGDKMLNSYHVPEDETPYKEALFLDEGYYANKPEQILRQIEQSPNISRIIPHYESFIEIKNISDNPDKMSAMQDRSLFQFFCTTDTSLLSFYNLKPHWLVKNHDISECVILNESLYNQFMELGIIDNGTLTINEAISIDGHLSKDKALPIVGTIPDIPYSNRRTSIFIHPEWQITTQYVLLPKPGKHAALMNETEATVRRIEPYASNNIVTNFTDKVDSLNIFRSMRTIAMILGMVSLIICAMGIYSTIALDTRSRKKEVAIRKAHGAQHRDIYLLFGRIYIYLILIAFLSALPWVLLFYLVMNIVILNLARGTLPIVMPCLLGLIIIIVPIALIVVWHIRKVMRVECEELIAKE